MSLRARVAPCCPMSPYESYACKHGDILQLHIQSSLDCNCCWGSIQRSLNIVWHVLKRGIANESKTRSSWRLVRIRWCCWEEGMFSNHHQSWKNRHTDFAQCKASKDSNGELIPPIEVPLASEVSSSSEHGIARHCQLVIVIGHLIRRNAMWTLSINKLP